MVKCNRRRCTSLRQDWRRWQTRLKRQNLAASKNRPSASCRRREAWPAWDTRSRCSPGICVQPEIRNKTRILDQSPAWPDAILIIQSLTFYNNEHLPNSKTNCQTLNKPLKMPKALIFLHTVAKFQQIWSHCQSLALSHTHPIEHKAKYCFYTFS